MFWLFFLCFEGKGGGVRGPLGLKGVGLARPLSVLPPEALYDSSVSGAEWNRQVLSSQKKGRGPGRKLARAGRMGRRKKKEGCAIGGLGKTFTLPALFFFEFAWGFGN